MMGRNCDMSEPKNNPITRKGKIARLPYEIRQQINELIRDGAPASRLNTFLIDQGYEAVNDQNWTNWRHGGYQDWLKKQAYLDEVREEYETVRGELEAGGFSILDKAILDVVLELKGSGLSPDKVASAIAGLKAAVTGSKRTEIADLRARLAKEALDLEREKFHAAQKRAAQADEAEGVLKDKTLTPEQKDRKYKEIFGIG